MTSVERVKAICKERKIPLSKIEKDLGFANGYISQLRKGTFPADRLQKIADYLDLSPSFLINGTTEEYYINEETAAMAQEIYENKELRVLFDAARNTKPEDLKIVRDMLLALKKKENPDYDEGC